MGVATSTSFDLEDGRIVRERQVLSGDPEVTRRPPACNVTPAA
jgi:hypothetical protein